MCAIAAAGCSLESSRDLTDPPVPQDASRIVKELGRGVGVDVQEESSSRGKTCSNVWRESLLTLRLRVRLWEFSKVRSHAD